ncbi:MAG: ABC transporter ATP-binding protein [Alphaproteobacteria bacterium]|nr:ABC transporter ATP-binding protein [Alphaproteobacteria bacterium]
MTLLADLRDLRVALATPAGPAQVLDGVSLEIPRGRIVGLVGESGSGKSTLALALLGLLPASLSRLDGSIRLDGEELVGASPERLQALRGTRMAMIFQDPMTALNPLFTVATQLADVLKRREPGLSGAERRARLLGMLDKVGIADPERRLHAYPHELSGGMRQRVMIAMALLCRPDLLIADEPTTALDVTIEAQIAGLIRDLRRDFAGSILFISHSLGLVAELTDEVAVLYAGTLVESGPTAEVFARPRHPYTSALLACEADLDRDVREALSIPGEVPSPLERGTGCVFASRCIRAEHRCREETPLPRPVEAGRIAACHFA